MFDFFKKKESPARKAFREEFEQYTKALRDSEEIAQIAVGHSINMANSFFMQTYSGPDEFINRPRQEQMSYIQKLTAMENKLADSDPQASLGFGLFKMWVGALAENDKELIENFSNELAYFSRKGDLPIQGIKL